MRYIILLLLYVSFTFSKGFDYSASLSYTFDSNIGQNYVMQSGNYFIPKLKGAYSFNAIPLYIKGDFMYDYHVIERSFKENSPLISIEIGNKFKKKKFHCRPFYSYSLFLAKMKSAEQSSKTKLFKVEHSFATSFSLKKKRKEVRLLSGISYENYGLSSDPFIDTAYSKHEFWLNTSIRVERTWKSKKQKLKLLALRSEIQYKHFLSKKAENTYNNVKFEINSKLKVYYPHIGCAMSYGKKLYHSQIENPHTGEMQEGKNSNWKIEPSINIPIVSDLYFQIKGAFQKKSSRLPEDNYTRNMLSLKVGWN